MCTELKGEKIDIVTNGTKVGKEKDDCVGSGALPTSNKKRRTPRA
jgi:hypothetical protein